MMRISDQSKGTDGLEHNGQCFVVKESRPLIIMIILNAILFKVITQAVHLKSHRCSQKGQYSGASTAQQRPLIGRVGESSAACRSDRRRQNAAAQTEYDQVLSESNACMPVFHHN